jgi:hypothetical protein
MHTLYQRGYGFSHEHALALFPMLLSFFRHQEYQDVSVIAHALDYSAKTEAWADMHHNIELISYQMMPQFIKLGLISEQTFGMLYQQALIDMQADAFCGIGHVTMIIGQKPPTHCSL